MEATTVAIDLAKSVFEIAVADGTWRITERRRFTRMQLERFFAARSASHVVMEACSYSHHWARWLQSRGIRVSLLPAQYVRAYVRRDKTDRTDAAALLEAARCGEIRPVCVKSVEQQALQGLHRIRTLWMKTRTSRINSLRALCREFGMTAPVGARRGFQELLGRFAEDSEMIPALLRPGLCQLIEEIRALEGRIRQIEGQLRQLAGQSEVCRRLQTIPGVGLLGSTALLGSVGDIHSFDNARRFASWVGSDASRVLFRDHAPARPNYPPGRLLCAHAPGARCARGTAFWTPSPVGRPAARPPARVALRLEARSCHNKAVIAIANKLARIVWATWHREQDFEFRTAPAQAAYRFDAVFGAERTDGQRDAQECQSDDGSPPSQLGGNPGDITSWLPLTDVTWVAAPEQAAGPGVVVVTGSKQPQPTFNPQLNNPCPYVDICMLQDPLQQVVVTAQPQGSSVLKNILCSGSGGGALQNGADVATNTGSASDLARPLIGLGAIAAGLSKALGPEALGAEFLAGLAAEGLNALGQTGKVAAAVGAGINYAEGNLGDLRKRSGNCVRAVGAMGEAVD
jgi:transposase